MRKQAIPGLFIFDLRFHCDALLVAVVFALLLLLVLRKSLFNKPAFYNPPHVLSSLSAQALLLLFAT